MTYDKRFSHVLASNAIGGPFVSALVHHTDFKDSKKWYFLPVFFLSFLVSNVLFDRVLIPLLGDGIVCTIGLNLLYFLILGIIGAWGYRRCSTSVGTDIAAAHPGFARRECIGVILGIIINVAMCYFYSMLAQQMTV